MWAIKKVKLVALVAAFVSCLGRVPGLAAGNTDYSEAGLKEHNNYRSSHGSGAMELDPNLNDAADKCAEYYANKGGIDHSCAYKNGAGENLYQASGGSASAVDAVKNAVKSWYDEVKDYDFNKNEFNFTTGHFTQVVWKASKKLGIGYKTQDRNAFVVGLYSPPGNLQGAFKENVSPAQGSKAATIPIKASAVVACLLLQTLCL